MRGAKAMAPAFLAAVFVMPADASAEYYREVKSGPLNVRTGPSRSSRVIRTLKKGARVLVTRRQGAWSRIRKPVWGWVYTAYLGPRYRYVKADAVNLRTAPTTRSRVVRVLKKGTRVQVVKFGKAWAKLGGRFNGRWILKRYLSRRKPGSGGGTIRLGARSAAGFVNLPSSGYGFTTYTGAGYRWGRPRMVSGLITMGRRWRDGYPGVRGRYLNYGDISLRNGGYFPPHMTHRNGVDVDMAPITTSGSGGGTSVGSWSYSTYYNVKFARLQRSVWSVRMMLHNNGRVPGVTFYPGHYDHFHTSIY